ncbi:MAG TPA: hypothetical protein PLO25_01955 [Candidatus Saccharibacteria bacterium]|nr:hypothetical protein [Candidatus Saccharibacteria bacterium]
MKKNTAIILNVVSLIIISDAIGIGYKLMAFLFVGVIPFTDIVLSSIQMMILMSVMLSAILARIIIMPIIKRNITQINTKQIKVKVATRRLSRV